jgi:hypothetical protein
MNWRRWFGGGDDRDEEEIAEEYIGKELVHITPPSQEGAKDKYERVRGTPLMNAIMPSGVWVVIKFSDALEAGGVEDPRKAEIIKAPSGEQAIQDVYTADVASHGSRADLVDAKNEDGRYVALDFYTGHRVEALVRGGWKAELEVAR